MRESNSIYKPTDPFVEYSTEGFITLLYTVSRDCLSEADPYISVFQATEEEMETVGTFCPGAMSLSH